MIQSTLCGLDTSRIWCRRVALIMGAPVMGFFGLRADEPSANKDGYNLFHPVPSSLMRELSADRPDKTESPYTVDAGHVQLEMDFANFTRDTAGGSRSRAWNIAPFNLKVGILNHVDVQLVYGGYLNVRTEDKAASRVETRSGFGDFITRLKVNLWGNDGGSTAFALLPFVKFPANTAGLGNRFVEGGLILPLAVELPAGWGLGLETGVAEAHDEPGGGRHAEFVNSVTVSHRIVGELEGYVEFFSQHSPERHAAWVGTLDCGLTYGLTRSIQLDCGCNFGVTDEADDINVFAGVTVRL